MSDHDFYGDHDDAVARAEGPVADYPNELGLRESDSVEECPDHVPFTKPCPECERPRRKWDVWVCPRCSNLMDARPPAIRATCAGGVTAATAHEPCAMERVTVEEGDPPVTIPDVSDLS